MAQALTEILEKLSGLKLKFSENIAQVKEQKQLEEIRIKYLGRKGELASYFNMMGNLTEIERPEVGNQLNILKKYFQETLDQMMGHLKPSGNAAEFFDITLPGISAKIGSKHPLYQVLDEIKDIFVSLGFSIEMGPELETDYYNFEALNFPENHPSRDLQDTFYITDKLLLRTHTSPVQIRTMERMTPPVRMIAPGKCFRKDAPDATHSPVFHQVEGLCVDEGVTFADLKGVITAFARRLFGAKIKIRFRPGFFPFTEPSAEYDFSCIFCNGKGCNVCKRSGWLEISGAGMVDPAVFKFVGYDSEKYTGYAFGMGVERIAMLKYGIDDIRTFFENDLRFLNQF